MSPASPPGSPIRSFVDDYVAKTRQFSRNANPYVAACYLVSTLIYRRVFRPLEISELDREARPELTSEVAGD